MKEKKKKWFEGTKNGKDRILMWNEEKKRKVMTFDNTTERTNDSTARHVNTMSESFWIAIHIQPLRDEGERLNGKCEWVWGRERGSGKRVKEKGWEMDGGGIITLTQTFESIGVLCCCISPCRSCKCVQSLAPRGRLGSGLSVKSIWRGGLWKWWGLATTDPAKCLSKCCHYCLYLDGKFS